MPKRRIISGIGAGQSACVGRSGLGAGGGNSGLQNDNGNFLGRHAGGFYKSLSVYHVF